MKTIRSQADLDRANIQVAWSMAHTMTCEQFQELCRVTVEQWERDGACVEPPRSGDEESIWDRLDGRKSPTDAARIMMRTEQSWRPDPRIGRQGVQHG